jgi:uncharacterized protein
MVKLLPAFVLFVFMVLIMAIIPPHTSVALHPDSHSPTQSASEQKEYKQCWLVLLKPGARQPLSKEQNDRIQQAHLQCMQQLSANGAMLAAGPIAGKGAFVLDCQDSLQAVQLLKTDSAILSGVYEYELKRWYTLKEGEFK